MGTELPRRDSTDWWNAYVERMATDSIFEKKVRKIVDVRHENAALWTRESRRKQGWAPFGREAIGTRCWWNEQARLKWPSPDPFEDGWKPKRNLGPVEALTFKVGGSKPKDWPAF